MMKAILLFLFCMIVYICEAQSDSLLYLAVQQSRQNNGAKEYLDFFTEIEKCKTNAIANLCDSPLEPNLQSYPCLDAWVSCSKNTSFYNRTKNLYEENASLGSSLNFSETYPIKWGTDPIDLITATNDFIFLISSAKYMLRERLSKYSIHIDFWNQMTSQFSTCITLSVGNNTVPNCGVNVGGCVRILNECLFKSQSFYMSFHEELPLYKLINAHEYALVPIALPDCDLNSNCNSTQQTLFLQQKMNAYIVNLIAYLYHTVIAKTHHDITGFYVLIGISLGVILILTIFTIYSQVDFYKKNKRLNIGENDDDDEEEAYNKDD